MEEKVEELISKLDNIRCYGGDKELDHQMADNILLDIISEYGHPEVKEIFNDIDKYYV